MANTAMINHDFAPNGARIVPWCRSTNTPPLTGLAGIKTARGATPEDLEAALNLAHFTDFKVSLPSRSVWEWPLTAPSGAEYL